MILRGGHEGIMLRLGDKEIEIDCELVPIILWLWQQGIQTSYCCQGDDEQFAYIAFPPGQHARNFGHAIIRLGLPEAKAAHKFGEQNKVWGLGCHKFLRTHVGIAEPENWAWQWSCVYMEKYNDFVFTCRFPHSDIAKITERLPSPEI